MLAIRTLYFTKIIQIEFNSQTIKWISTNLKSDDIIYGYKNLRKFEKKKGDFSSAGLNIKIYG